MNERGSTIAIITGATVLVLVLVIGIVVGIPKQTEEVVRAGSIELELAPGDESFLDQVNRSQDPQAPNPAFGGSSIEQAPSLGTDEWLRILEGELE